MPRIQDYLEAARLFYSHSNALFPSPEERATMIALSDDVRRAVTLEHPEITFWDVDKLPPETGLGTRADRPLNALLEYVKTHNPNAARQQHGDATWFANEPPRRH